jgi:hypothetical protein
MLKLVWNDNECSRGAASDIVLKLVNAFIATVIRLQWDQDLLAHADTRARVCSSWQTRGANQTIKHMTTCALVRMSAHTNDEKTEEERVCCFPNAESVVPAAAYRGGAVVRRGHRADSFGVP